MRRLIFTSVLIISVLIVPSACKRKKRADAERQQQQQSGGMATMLHTSDPNASPQLIRGFHTIESSWRWTQKTFAVTLKPPANAAKTGATLLLQLAISEPIAKSVGAQTLSARIGGIELAPEIFSKPGRYSYTRDVPASALGGDSVTVEFTLDKAAAGTGGDIRELGVIVSMVGFEARQ